MKDHPDRARLHDLARRLGRSELHFVGQASPYTPAHRVPALATLREIVAADTRAVHEFVGWLLDQRMPVDHFGAFPMRLTALSYLSLDHLLPRLLAAEQAAVQALESDRAALTTPAARDQVDTLLALKKRHVFRLEVLVSEGAGRG